MKLVSAEIVDDDQVVSLAELCHCCGRPAEQMLSLVEHGIIAPLDETAPASRWRFTRETLLRAQSAVRLQRDLGVNLAGAALALDLLDELRTLRRLVQTLSR
ncbi:MAG TPA: MerR family transcriptional regulator [Gammaproteobacteria bacterium]|nr:MerR family transcriptional regulator [Gammaproteobacteria bacterium]